MGRTAVSVSAALVALAFACSTFERWLARRRRHELAWSGALLLFVVAAASLAVGAGLGWDGPTFRVFYLFGAILNVPFLALGTVYLLWGPRVGDRAAVGLGMLGAFAVGVVVTAPFTAAIPRHTLVQGSHVFPVLPRVLQVVDVYDALRTARSYKPPLTHEMAALTMREEAARGLWDAELVGEYFYMLEQQRLVA